LGENWVQVNPKLPIAFHPSGETSGIARYLLGNLSLKEIEPKLPQSKGIADLGPLGQELEPLDHQIKVNSRGFLGQSHQPKKHMVLIRDTQQEFHKKTPSKLCQENHKKGLRKSPKRKTGETTQGLEQPRRIIYTCHEGSYKVYLATRSSIPLSRSHMKLSSKS
jgi:hypothetical protein